MDLQRQIERIPWREVQESLCTKGFAPLGQLLAADTCRALIASYDNDTLFRSRIDMARYRFGRGEYKYFAYPLPDFVARLREGLYSGLSDIAGEWMRDLCQNRTYPPTLGEFLETCDDAGQCRPTPILLRYKPGDFNCLHQDIYGEIFFPFQVICSLNEPGEDYDGGELMLVEQRPRTQSIGHVLHPRRGEPSRSQRGTGRYRAREGSTGRTCGTVSARFAAASDTLSGSSSTMASNG